MKVLTSFITAAVSPERFPKESVPEIAFLGRSNVGKSSLINSLVGNKIAKTSNTPGRTQTINFFELRWPGKPNPAMYFVDLPGYGYARVPKELQQQWSQFVDPYLAERKTLALCLCLVDANIPPQTLDAQLIDYLKEVNRPFLVVATKIDRVGNKLQGSLNAIKAELGVNTLLPYSAKTGQGQQELWNAIRTAAEGSAGSSQAQSQ